MTSSLPTHPSLENLKKQAKTLQKKWRAGDPGTLARIRAAHPKHSAVSDEQLRAAKPRLTDCQLVLAREAGFDSWRRMKVVVLSANQALADQFINFACLCYDDPHYDHRSFHARAHEMLVNHPELAAANIWAAAAAGNARAVESFLVADAGMVNRPGPHGWPPLLCACYSRVKPIDPSHSTLQVARTLLDHGADPNAYTLKYNDPPGSDRARRFTALTGIFGGGSTGLANQPPHPDWRELAELLLSRGADPADEMALAINQDASLEILLRHGLKPGAMASNGITLMGRSLSQAARHGNIDQARLLIDRGARMDERFNNKLPWEHASRLGRVEVARVLEKAGAPLTQMDELGRFIAACMAGDETAARALLATNPDLHSRAPLDLVHRAVWTRNIEAVKLTLDLGFDPNAIEDNGAIHHAGVLAERDDILRLLLDRGASLKLRDPWYDGTGIGWADFFNHVKLRDKLLNEPGICLFDALDYNRFDRIPDILARDPAALNRPFATCLTREPRPEDWHTPLVRMVDAGKTAAVRVLLEHGADATARHPDGRSLVDLARDKGFKDIRDLLEPQGACRPVTL